MADLSGPSGWWGIAIGAFSLALTGYSSWINKQKWDDEKKRQKAHDEKSQIPKLKIDYVAAEKKGQWDYSLPGFEIHNVGDVPAENFKVEFLFEDNCPEQSRKQILSYLKFPTKLDPGTSCRGTIFLGPGGSIYLTLVVTADSMDEKRWPNRFVRG
jgi:hypothetical protein